MAQTVEWEGEDGGGMFLVICWNNVCARKNQYFEMGRISSTDDEGFQKQSETREKG